MLPPIDFQIGDYVIGTKEATKHYGITKEGWVGKVTALDKYTFEVYGKDHRGIDSFFYVDPKYFELYNPQSFNQNEFQQIL